MQRVSTVLVRKGRSRQVVTGTYCASQISPINVFLYKLKQDKIQYEKKALRKERRDKQKKRNFKVNKDWKAIDVHPNLV